MARAHGLLLSLVVAACAKETAPSGKADDITATCPTQPSCDDSSEPALGVTGRWRHLTSSAVAASRPNHRGRDALVVQGEAQWIIGKFAYGLTDKDLKGEDVDIYVERGCAGQWEKIGTATTTHDREHPTIEGVEDSGGRIYFQIPEDRALPLGRHRVRLVVVGDHTHADALVDVVTKDAPVFITDVDGTLTSSEFAEFRKLLEGELPKPEPDAARVLSSLAAKGLQPVYLTGRPEWLKDRTREFLVTNGFPLGTIRTTSTMSGATGSEAEKFKENELQAFVAKGVDIRWAFGNQPSDALAYAAAHFVNQVARIFFRVFDPNGGRQIQHYAELFPDVAASTVVCAPPPAP